MSTNNKNILKKRSTMKGLLNLNKMVNKKLKLLKEETSKLQDLQKEEEPQHSPHITSNIISDHQPVMEPTIVDGEQANDPSYCLNFITKLAVTVILSVSLQIADQIKNPCNPWIYICEVVFAEVERIIEEFKGLFSDRLFIGCAQAIFQNALRSSDVILADSHAKSIGLLESFSINDYIVIMHTQSWNCHQAMLDIEACFISLVWKCKSELLKFWDVRAIRPTGVSKVILARAQYFDIPISDVKVNILDRLCSFYRFSCNDFFNYVVITFPDAGRNILREEISLSTFLNFLEQFLSHRRNIVFNDISFHVLKYDLLWPTLQGTEECKILQSAVVPWDNRNRERVYDNNYVINKESQAINKFEMVEANKTNNFRNNFKYNQNFKRNFNMSRDYVRNKYLNNRDHYSPSNYNNNNNNNNNNNYFNNNNNNNNHLSNNNNSSNNNYNNYRKYNSFNNGNKQEQQQQTLTVSNSKEELNSKPLTDSSLPNVKLDDSNSNVSANEKSDDSWNFVNSARL